MIERERLKRRIAEIEQDAARQIEPLKARLAELDKLERFMLEQKTGVTVGTTYRMNNELLEFMYTSPYNRDDKDWIEEKYARFSVRHLSDDPDGINCFILTLSGWTIGGIPAEIVARCEKVNEHA